MTAAELIAALVASLGTVYPARTAAMSNRPGRVTCIVMPDSGEFMSAGCDPVPVEVTVEVHVLAAGSDERAVLDLLTHLDPVASLIRGADFHPSGWRSGTYGENGPPEIVVTASADGKG